MKTLVPKPNEIEHKWYLVNAEGKHLGRLASKIAQILRGKGKPDFTSHLDSGDHVVVINAEKVVFSGKKLQQKKKYHYTGFPGGLKERKYEDLFTKNPAKMVEAAVRGMLPHHSLGRKIFQKLHVYGGEKHPHEAQKPETLKV
ncbi:MAG: 50S ribosomal protein L13 [Candidatus Edwardsbacteria bacterium]